MSKLYENKITQNEANKASHDNKGLVDDPMSGMTSPDGKRDAENKSNGDSPGEGNVIKVQPNGLYSNEDDTTKISNSKKSDQVDSQTISANQTEVKSDDVDIPHQDTSSSFLRRSERNAKYGHSSYKNLVKRPSKYEDFEVGPMIGQKSSSQMDPPGSVGSNKRKRKVGNIPPLSLPEASLKRTASTKMSNSSSALSLNDEKEVVYNQGRWTCLEHFKFLEALKKFGKEWQKVQQHVHTRTSTQARSHAQKFFVKLDK
mmetsp:Transcript_26242/g.26149  ORF Transcript_26242/g.26149 Transcript_26242/m.26149 type:complete len:258 (-) Transcript_26242:1028-1801(-)